jgi:hypothetical protein
MDEVALERAPARREIGNGPSLSPRRLIARSPRGQASFPVEAYREAESPALVALPALAASCHRGLPMNTISKMLIMTNFRQQRQFFREELNGVLTH